jgi:predicted double-glycine peptidase
MLTSLVAALSLASSVMLDVPFVAQTDALCGGAAVAMVFRYWGDAHADVEQFAPLVDRRGRGIADDVLVDAVRRRGWQALRVDGSIEQLRSHLRERQPVIVLVADRRDTYHYLVVTGATADRVIVHDPSRGPSRAIPEREFVRVWKPTNFWSLVVQPAGAVSHTPVTPRATFADDRDDECDALLGRAIADIQVRGLSAADSLLNGVRAQCPASSGPLRELAGVRFAQRRWSEAAAFARQAVALDASDEYAWDVLGSSLFVQDDSAGALRAWNRIGKPRIDVVRIDGIQHARYQAITDALAIRSNTALTAETFERARRRIDDLPDRASARIAFRPQADGFATVDVIVSERSVRPRGTAEWTAAAARTAIDREVMVAVPGGTGQGELWTASWRWWAERPRVAVGFATPRAGRLPGVWRVDASWEEQSYTFDASPGSVGALRESRVHGGLTVSDWMTGTVRYSVGAGVDTWNGDRKTAFVGASLERRSPGDRLSLAASATNWSPLTSHPGFASLDARAQFRSSSRREGWVYRGAVGSERVSDAGPLALWPSAGDGHARAPLLRAHPLLDDGAIDATRSSAFGRTLAYANVEVQRWFDRPLVPRVGLAAFADCARASRGAAASSPVPHVDVGGGLRIRIPGAEGVLRIDAAHGIRDGANALTFGWQF